MKQKLERIAEISIIGLFIFLLIITYKEHSFEFNLSKLIEIITWIGLYFIQVKWLMPKLVKERKLKYVTISFVILIVSILINILFKANYFEEMHLRKYYSLQPAFYYILNFKWYLFGDTLNIILISFFIASVYGFLRNVKLPERSMYQKILPLSFFSVIILGIVGFAFLVGNEVFKKHPAYHYKTISENKDIYFIENVDSLSTFADIPNIINKNKPVCILFWARSCSGQIDNIITLNKIREEVSNNLVDFVYVCGEYKQENDFIRWKDHVISQNLEGYNIYLKRDVFSKIFIGSLGLKNGLQDINLILLNSKHEIVNKLHLSNNNKTDLIDLINKL